MSLCKWHKSMIPQYSELFAWWCYDTHYLFPIPCSLPGGIYAFLIENSNFINGLDWSKHSHFLLFIKVASPFRIPCEPEKDLAAFKELAFFWGGDSHWTLKRTLFNSREVLCSYKIQNTFSQNIFYECIAYYFCFHCIIVLIVTVNYFNMYLHRENF